MKKKKSKIKEVQWLSTPELHDYDASLSYLMLAYDIEKSKEIVKRLKDCKEILWFKAKDLYRMSRLPMLPYNDLHVKNNLKKIKNGKKLSPLLLVRDPANSSVIIVDGFHRLCSVYNKNYDISIPCKIV